MTELPADANNILTIGGVIGAAIVGSVTKSAQWVDKKTGRFSPLLMFSGIALCLVFGSFVHWAGVERGIDQWTQIVITGVGCYMGPDILIRAFASAVFKRIGVDVDGTDKAG